MDASDPVVELLWFADCPNHEATRRALGELVAVHAPSATVRDIDATDPTVAVQMRFPGSPTIRVDGLDVAPGFMDPGDYTPRCRLYRTAEGPRGLPDPAWIATALTLAVQRRAEQGG